MKREILSEEKIDESALNFISNNFKSTIDEIMHSLANHKIVVVGMAYISTSFYCWKTHWWGK